MPSPVDFLLGVGTVFALVGAYICGRGARGQRTRHALAGAGAVACIFLVAILLAAQIIRAQS
jgi:hypothetical protein